MGLIWVQTVRHSGGIPKIFFGNKNNFGETSAEDKMYF